MLGGIFMQYAGAVAGIWKQFGMEPNQALKSLVPIAQGVCLTLESDGVPDGLAGPYVRGDVGTIQNMSTLSGLSLPTCFRPTVIWPYPAWTSLSRKEMYRRTGPRRYVRY